LTPSDTIRNDLLVTYFNGKQHLNLPVTQKIGGPAAAFFPNVVAAFANQQVLGNRTVAHSTAPNNDDNESYLISNATTIELGDDISIKNIFGYSNVHNVFRLDATSLNFPLVDVGQDRHQDQISNELQLFGKSGGLNWIVGGFYSKQKTRVDQQSIIFGGIRPLAKSTDEFTSKAVFGQGTYDFGENGLDGVKLTGGLRYTWDERAGSNDNFVVPLITNEKRLSYTVGMDYQATNNVLIYIAHRRSYKTGGFNLISTGFPAELARYKSETLADVEIGAKTQFELGTIPMRANVAFYKGNYKDIQTKLSAACGSGGLNSLIINAGKGTPKGVEFEFEVSPFKGMNISGYYNRTLGKYDQFTVPTVNGCTLAVDATALSGQTFGNISKDTFGLNAAYTLPLPETIGEVRISGNMYNRSRRLGNDLTGFDSPLQGYTILNFRLDYDNIAQSNFSVGVYVKNATKKLYAVTRNEVLNLAGYDTQIFGDPRTFGVDASFKF
jgi:iron complex outermembrane receptor protein